MCTRVLSPLVFAMVVDVVMDVEIQTIRVSESLCILIVRSQEYFHNHDTQVTLHNLHNSHVNH